MDIAQQLESLRNLSYDSGWMSGKIETSSKSPDLLITEKEEAHHGQLISDRDDVYVTLQNSVLELKQQNADLVAALRDAFEFLDGLDFSDHPEWADMVTQVEQALAQVGE